MRVAMEEMERRRAAGGGGATSAQLEGEVEREDLFQLIDMPDQFQFAPPRSRIAFNVDPKAFKLDKSTVDVVVLLKEKKEDPYYILFKRIDVNAKHQVLVIRRRHTNKLDGVSLQKVSIDLNAENGKFNIRSYEESDRFSEEQREQE